MDAKEFYFSKPWLKFYPSGVPHTVEIPPVPVTALFDGAAEKYGNKAALIFYGEEIRYRQLRDAVDRFAAALADLGIGKGQRVALYLLNSPQFVIAYFGILKTGATVTPISPVYTSIEVRHQLQDSGAKTIVCQDILYENVQKTGLELENVILTGVEEYLPSVMRFLGKGVLKRRLGDRSKPPEEIYKRTGFYRLQDLLKKYPPRPPAVTIDPRVDVASLPYTGGTTGPSKGVLLTHANLVACQQQIQAFWEPEIEEGKEVVIAFLPFYHIYGQVAIMLNSLISGLTLVLFTTPDYDEILYAIEKYNATVFYGVPTIYEFLREYEKTVRVNWQRLKVIVCGADTLHEKTINGWKQRTGADITEGYGMTETSAVSHITPPERPKVGSFGVPIPNVLAAVVDPETNAFLPPGEVGELIISAPNIMEGYWQQPEETARALIELEERKWLKTGDLARMDEEGYFYFYDRKKDLIKYKGYSVFAREVEEVLYSHPQVKMAGVIGVPDPKVGQIIKANVVLFSEARGKVSEDEIIAYCKERLAHYKVPQIVEFRGELPKTDVGKVSRRELREEAEGL
ncbi:MAG: long-chain fatty acid--CoA ligase [Bacillota bacterium]